MSPKEFQQYRPKTLLGASMLVKAPTGQYDSLKLINIGTNRWSFKPELGVVRVMGRWAIDAYLGGWFYTDNTDFLDGMTRKQDPIVSTQAHVRYHFSPTVWAALDGNFWWGGQSTVDGVENDDLQRNSRVGATVAIRIGRNHSLRIAASAGAFTRIGGDFNSIGVSYGYSWVNVSRGKQ
ncbi:MAG: transporter [Acidobacteriota bacterium]